MSKNYIIRYTRENFEAAVKHFEKAREKESQMFTLFSRAASSECEIFVAHTQILPDSKDLRNQSSVSVEPSKEVQAIVYGLASEMGKSVGDEHTHPFTEKPSFSSIDEFHGEKNALYLCDHLRKPATMAMVVFGRGLKCFEARVWNRRKSRFETVDRLEILGSPVQILTKDRVSDILDEDPYARHRIIPGWEQGRLDKLKVFVCGLGGNGALVWQSLVALGIGRNGGWIKACDPDIVETSNLPRIPYAFHRDVGRSKASIARSYARRKAPKMKVACYQDSINSERMQNIAKEANCIIGAVDNDGSRKIYNRLAIRYLIPLLDVGSEIIPSECSYEAVGQVRTVLPGKTGCLICSGVIDSSEAALDLMSGEGKQGHAKVGYVRGTDKNPTPSVLHLNGAVSHLAISQFLRLIFGEETKGKEFLHYDRQACSLLAASVQRDPECPVCGRMGYLGAGDLDHEIAAPELGNGTGRFAIVDGKIIREDTVAVKHNSDGRPLHKHLENRKREEIPV